MLDAAAIGAIDAEISKNVAQLYLLGKNHYLFARRQDNREWRQKISRLYYASYNASRAVRLFETGDFATDVSDHKKIEMIPPDFPNRNTYANRLGVLRGDRNLCDYDHTASQEDLALGINESVELVADFLRDAQIYLEGRGVTI